MPQHVHRKRFRRKELRQPDEFETLTGQAVAWVRGNPQILLGVLAAVVVAALAGVLFGRMRAARQEAAAVDFGTAHTAFEAGKFAQAADAFATLAREHPRTSSGRLAGLYRAHAVARQGDPAAAATAYGEYLATSPEPAYLRQAALTGLAQAKEASGDTAAALEAYLQAGALEGPYRTDALLGASRLQEATGHADQAREVYARLLKEAPDPRLRELLLAKLPPGDRPSEGAGAEAPPEAAGANVR